MKPFRSSKIEVMGLLSRALEMFNARRVGVVAGAESDFVQRKIKKISCRKDLTINI
jgi:hypothetical protein